MEENFTVGSSGIWGDSRLEKL